MQASLFGPRKTHFGNTCHRLMIPSPSPLLFLWASHVVCLQQTQKKCLTLCRVQGTGSETISRGKTPPWPLFNLALVLLHLTPLQALHEESREEGNTTENFARTRVVSSRCQTFSTELRVYLRIVSLRGTQKSLTCL